MKNRLFHTLQGKLILLVTMLSMVSLIFFLGNYYLSDRMGDKYVKLIKENQVLSQYTKRLMECKSNLVEYSNSYGDQNMIQAYKKNFEKLKERAQELFEAFPNSYVENLVYLSNEISAQGQSVITEMEEGHIENARSNYEQFVSDCSLVDKYMLYVQQAISNTSLQKIYEINTQQSYILRSMVLVFTSIIVLLTFLSFRRIRNIVRPIKHLTEMAHLVVQNVWDLPKWNDPQEDETGVLLTSFYHMVQTIQNQIELLKQQQKLEMERKEEEGKKLQLEYRNVQLELKALQNQVNPHFLFNCLNMISKQAYIEEAPDTQHTTEAVARYLRSVLDQTNEIVSIEQELEGVKNYLAIQRMRFGERFEYELHCDAECSFLHVPFMILQPLVENIFTHGIDRCAREIKLKCDIKKEKNGVWIYVEDNGPGMDEKRVEQLREIVENTAGDYPPSGIGLINVFRRMQLYFREQVEIVVDSKPYERTVIGFLIPENGLEKKAIQR